MKKFDPNTLKPIRLKDQSKLFRYDPHSGFLDREIVAAALTEALMDGDKEAFQDIIIGYLSVINKEELSRRSKVPIATIRRIAAGSNYNIDTLFKITSAIKKAA